MAIQDGWVIRRYARGGDAVGRVIFEGPEDTARVKFGLIQSKLRQGGVTLIRPDGKVELSSSAPNLRTRW